MGVTGPAYILQSPLQQRVGNVNIIISGIAILIADKPLQTPRNCKPQRTCQ